MSIWKELDRFWHEQVAIHDGKDLVPQGAMRVGPNTDALVWKLCDTNETVEL